MSSLARIAAVLEGLGMQEELAELHRLERIASAAEAHTETLAQVTRTLLASDKTYRIVFSHEMDAMSLFDVRTGELLDVNDAWVSLYGYSREEALELTVSDVSAEPADTRARIAQVEAGGITRIPIRWHRSKQGVLFPVELTAGRLRVGERDLMYASARDISERVNAERALARSEASFRALIEGMPDAVIVHRGDSIVYMNPSGRRLLGWSLDEDVVGTSVVGIVHPADREAVAARIEGIVAHGTPAPVLEQRVIRRDGTFVVVEVAGMGIVFDGEPAVLAMARDVTERKKMESQLVMNDRLASLGRLAASVGHELNNPLAYVLGNVSLLQRELASGEALSPPAVERCARFVQTIAEGVARMRQIVHDLKTLARADAEERVAIDVQLLLDACGNMVEHELAPRAKLVKDYRSRAFVRANEARLGQVFLNLLLNAAQAIDPGHPDDNEVRITLREEHDCVVVEISDTGAGIDPADRDRIFEPFFTTKEGVGTGLGLAISHQIVTKLGGTIATTPRDGRGTIFRVVVPSSSGPNA